MGFFSSLVCRIELILVTLVLYFFLIGLDTHNLSLRQLFFLAIQWGNPKSNLAGWFFFSSRKPYSVLDQKSYIGPYQKNLGVKLTKVHFGKSLPVPIIMLKK